MGGTITINHDTGVMSASAGTTTFDPNTGLQTVATNDGWFASNDTAGNWFAYDPAGNLADFWQ